MKCVSDTDIIFLGLGIKKPCGNRITPAFAANHSIVTAENLLLLTWITIISAVRTMFRVGRVFEGYYAFAVTPF
jgi:hypothetical protein